MSSVSGVCDTEFRIRRQGRDRQMHACRAARCANGEDGRSRAISCFPHGERAPDYWPAAPRRRRLAKGLRGAAVAAGGSEDLAGSVPPTAASEEASSFAAGLSVVDGSADATLTETIPSEGEGSRPSPAPVFSSVVGGSVAPMESSASTSSAKAVVFEAIFSGRSRRRH
jgi:hypothetical protein